jgi:chromosome segregation ATPase
MAPQIQFNHLTSIDRMTKGGFSIDQARASAEALEGALGDGAVTKSDFDRFRGDIDRMGRDITGKIDRLEQRLEAADERLKQLDGKVDKVEKTLRDEIGQLGRTLTARMDAGDQPLEERLGARIDRLDAKFEAKFEGMDGKIDSRADSVTQTQRAKIAASKVDTLRWVFALNIGMVSLIVTIMRLIH